MKACMNGHLEIVEMLLQFGANPRLENDLGETALSLSCFQQHVEICQRLVIANSNVNHRDVNGRTCLLKCARLNCKIEIVKMLLSAGADPELTDKNNNSPLHYAAIRGNIEMAGLIIEAGANCFAFNNDGMVPWELVVDSKIAKKQEPSDATQNKNKKERTQLQSLASKKQAKADSSKKIKKQFFMVCPLCRNSVELDYHCKQCHVVYYCSSKCHKDDFQNHQRFVCPILKNRKILRPGGLIKDFIEKKSNDILGSPANFE